MFPIISGAKSKLIAFCVPQEKILFWPYNKLNPLQIKPIRSRWLIISVVRFRLRFTDGDEKHAKTKMANIEPSCDRTSLVHNA